MIARRHIPLAWAIAAFLAVAAISGGPGISREEAGVLAAAGAIPVHTLPLSTASAVERGSGGEAPARPPLPALLSRATEAISPHLGASHLAGYRLAPALAAAVLAALMALLAGELAGPTAAALAPALLLAPPRLLLPLMQAGPGAAGAALIVATVLAYRRAVRATRRSGRIAAAIGCGGLFGLALAVQLEAAQLVAAFAIHAALLPLLLRLRPSQENVNDEPEPGSPPHPGPLPPRGGGRGGWEPIASMILLGPAILFALWPWLWTETLHRAAAALAGATARAPVIHMGRIIEAGPLPPGYPLVVTAFALPAAVTAVLAAGVLHTLSRLWRGVLTSGESTGPSPRLSTRSERGSGLPVSDDLLLVLAAAGPVVVAQLGIGARAPGPGPWLAAFPFLAVLGARAVMASAAAAWPSRAGAVTAILAAAALAPAVASSIHAYPNLGSAWGELAGGVPGAASLGLARHDGEAAASLLGAISERARPGARVLWSSIPPAALAVYAADGRVRPDLVTAATPADADLALVPVTGGARQEEYRVWAALRTRSPVTGAFLDEVPLGWVYARPGAWR